MIAAKWFDHRYFWRDERTCRCHYTCGLAREAGAVVVRRAKPDQFLADVWLNSLDSFERNPSVVGFIVEQTCLSAISSFGFGHLDLHWKSGSAETRMFSGDILNTLPSRSITSKTFYIPEQWSHKNIDALYLDIDERTKTVLVAPMQITMNHFHKKSETRFYANWERWVKHFDGFTLSSTFVWIVEHEHSWKIVEEQLRSIRSGSRLIAPQHKRIHITAGELFPPLGQRLAARHRRLKSSMCLPPELTFLSGDEPSEAEQPSSEVITNEVAKQTEVRSLSRKPSRTKAALLTRYRSQESEEMNGEDFSKAIEEMPDTTSVEAKKSAVRKIRDKGKAAEKAKV
jgi:hypothetical protein